jgi:Tol biopolymer transport system component
MGKLAEAPYRIFVTSGTDDGAPDQASNGSDNQGAPTWSTDGRALVYGRVFCQEERDCAIQEINLATDEQTTISGSEGPLQHDGLRMVVSSRRFVRTSTKSGSSIHSKGSPACRRASVSKEARETAAGADQTHGASTGTW